MMKFPERLKELRKKFDLTQEQLSNAFDVGKVTISLWERGQREPDYKTLAKIATYFNVTTDFLLGLTDEQKSSYAKDVMEWIDTLQKVGIDLADIENMSEDKRKILLAVFKGFKE